MSNRAPSSPTCDGNDLIRVLHEDDILLGRGHGPSNYCGNKRMRAIVDRRRNEYVTTESYNEKKRISKEVYKEVTSRGGRFLKRVKTEKLPGSTKERTVYKEVDAKTSLEKVKQSLREKQVPTKTGEEKQVAREECTEEKVVNTSHRDDTRTSSMLDTDLSDTPVAGELVEEFSEIPTTRRKEKHEFSVETNEVKGGEVLSQSGRSDELPLPSFDAELIDIPVAADLAEEFQEAESVANPILSTNVPTIVPATLPGRAWPPANDASLLLFQPFAFQQHQQLLLATAVQPSQHKHMMERSMYSISPRSLSMTTEYQQYLHDSLLGYSSTNSTRSNTVSDDVYGKTKATEEIKESERKGSAMLADSTSTSAQDTTIRGPDEDVSESILSMLRLGSNEPRFTELEERLEQETLTDEENAAILSDMLGEKCSVTSHQKKRPRREFDETTVSFLVKQMRAEIERIPQHKKQALTEAHEKCLKEEFSDSRLKRFLRCEGMNTKVSAKCLNNCFLVALLTPHPYLTSSWQQNALLNIGRPVESYLDQISAFYA